MTVTVTITLFCSVVLVMVVALNVWNYNHRKAMTADERKQEDAEVDVAWPA